MPKIIDYFIDQNKFSSYTPAHMANTKSAIKRIRRISKQTAVNKARKSRSIRNIFFLYKAFAP